MVRFWQTALRLSLLIAMVASAPLLTGCSKKETRKPVFVVTGKVTYNSSPIENATIVFHPIGEEGPNAVKSRGKTDAQGNFKLTTYDTNDGAPAGEYQVTVEQWLAGRPDEGPSNRLPAYLSKPESSGLKATVNKAPTEVPTFEIKQ